MKINQTYQSYFLTLIKLRSNWFYGYNEIVYSAVLCLAYLSTALSLGSVAFLGGVHRGVNSTPLLDKWNTQNLWWKSLTNPVPNVWLQTAISSLKGKTKKHMNNSKDFNSLFFRSFARLIFSSLAEVQKLEQAVKELLAQRSTEGCIKRKRGPN